MSLFTSNFRQSQITLFFLACANIGTLLLLSTALILPMGPSRSALVSTAKLPENDDYYLAYSSGGVDHFVLYYNFGHATDYARKADVLFLGNSKAKHAFRREFLDPFFEKRKLTYYNMAFGYGDPSPLPRAIIEKYDFHPKWVVINADPFFRLYPTSFSDKVMRLGSWNALKFRFETIMSFRVKRVLHSFVPYFDPVKQDWLEYRSYRDGTLELADYRGVPRTLTAPPRDPKFELEPGMVSAALEFKSEIEKRGGRIVLTYIPPPLTTASLPPEAAEILSKILNVPLIEPTIEGLSTIDGEHLNLESAARFNREFLTAFERILSQ